MDMSHEQEKRVTADEARERLTPDLALLLDAIRTEFEAKMAALWWKFLATGIPAGAVGGFVAEVLRPGTASAAVGLLPFV